MQKYQINLVRFIPKDRSEIFRYFTIPELLEEWSAPGDLSLKVPFFEAKKNGRYKYIHSKGQDHWMAEGYVLDIVPDERLIMVDTKISHNEKTILQDTKCILELKDVLGGTEISISHQGFPDQKTADECRESWNQCFDKLVRLTVADANQTDNIQKEITDF